MFCRAQLTVVPMKVVLNSEDGHVFMLLLQERKLNKHARRRMRYEKLL